MNNPQSPLLNKIVGKKIKRVEVSVAHGEVLTIYFTDHTYINICSTYGLSDKSMIKPDRNNIFVDIDGEVI